MPEMFGFYGAKIVAIGGAVLTMKPLYLTFIKIDERAGNVVFFNSQNCVSDHVGKSNLA
jgi:hypothetical protein